MVRKNTVIMTQHWKPVIFYSIDGIMSLSDRKYHGAIVIMYSDCVAISFNQLILVVVIF